MSENVCVFCHYNFDVSTFCYIVTVYFQVLEKEFTQFKPIHEHVIKKGEEMLQALKPGAEIEKLKQRLQDVDTRWCDVSEKINERRAKLQEVEPSASKYVECSEPFTTWLSESEGRLKECDNIPEDDESTTRQLELLEVCLVLHYIF